jgi:hypothetical protein
MPEINLTKNNLLETLKVDYPNYTFKSGKKFAFTSPRTIVIGPEQPSYDLLILHELAHAILGHKRYTQDIQRIKMERNAWDYVRTSLCKKYNISWNQNFAESELDTYRDWLHRKSLCPTCHLTRVQTPDGIYHCPFCNN